MTNLILIGFPKCGKSTIGKLLAQDLVMDFLDIDLLMSELFFKKYQMQLTVGDIFRHQGEVYFRALEKNIITQLHCEKTIIATGGGVVLDKENIKILKKLGRIIYLEKDYATLYERNYVKKPAYLNADNFTADFKLLYQHRKRLYQQAADVVFSVKNSSFCN